MSWIIAILIGGLVGWAIYSFVETRMNRISAIIAGAVGGFVLNILSYFLFRNFGSITLDLMGIVAGIIGSVIVLAIVESLISAYPTSNIESIVYSEEAKHRENEAKKRSKKDGR